MADTRPDGTVYVYTHSQNPQELRGEIAQMLGTSIDNVVVRTYAGPGHYGRSNGGNAGAEDEAVILSKAVGKPVRVQSMTSFERSPCRSIRATMAKSREVRKLDQKRATSSTDRGITMRLGSLTRNRLSVGRGRSKPNGERRQKKW